MINEQTVEKIKSAMDVVDVVSDFVDLKKRGGQWLGLCPFHKDTHPSLNVSRTKGIYKCFSCGAGGDAIRFLMEHEQMTYVETLCYLAKKYNIEVEGCNNVSVSKGHRTRRKQPIFKQEPTASFIDNSDDGPFKKSLKHYDRNHLITFLSGVFGVAPVNKMIGEYFIGTECFIDAGCFNRTSWYSQKLWDGSTVFWQIDRYGRVHGGKIMQYNPDNGKRVKELYRDAEQRPRGGVTWVHSALKIPDYQLSQCLFGEHLLARYPGKTVAIVESEKTAMIASGVFDDCITLATGGFDNLKFEMCEALYGRDVILMPDNGKYKSFMGNDGKPKDGWLEKGKLLRHMFERLRIADIMEREAKNPGDDIGDLILDHYPDIEQIDLGLKEL